MFSEVNPTNAKQDDWKLIAPYEYTGYSMVWNMGSQNYLFNVKNEIYQLMDYSYLNYFDYTSYNNIINEFRADITYGIVDSKIGINGIGSYANIVGHTLEINDLNVPTSFDKRDFWHYDMRIGFHFDIFFQSISIEYAIFGKQFAFQIIPINIRF